MNEEPTLTPAERNLMRDPPPTRRERIMGHLGAFVQLVVALFVLFFGGLWRWVKGTYNSVRHPRPLSRLEVKRRQEKWVVRIFGAVVVCVLLILIYGGISAYVGTEEYVTVTVLKAERVAYGSGDDMQHKYLVFTDQGTYECTDSLIYGKFNSSDVYGRIQAGQKYRLHVVGYRSQILSAYPNILDAHPAN